MPPSTRRQAQHHVPPPAVDFSGSDDDGDEEEMDPEEEDGDVMGDEMVAMDGEEDLAEEDGLGKSFFAACHGLILDFSVRNRLRAIPTCFLCYSASVYTDGVVQAGFQMLDITALIVNLIDVS